MPVRKCANGKYRIGEGPCVYDTKAKADRAYVAYLAKQNQKRKGGGSSKPSSTRKK